MPSTRRKRAVRVCAFCHDHKIRCDADSAGIPCSKCVELRETCTLRTRKQYPVRKKPQSRTYTSPPDDTQQCSLHRFSPPPLHPSIAKVVAAAVPDPSSRTTPIFVGTGGYGLILDALSSTRAPDRHFQIFAAAEKALAPEDLEYLKAKGCFILPEDGKELLRAYFLFAHPSFPVIDAKTFLEQYTVHGFEGVNLLLLWSIFSVGASYVEGRSLRRVCKEVYVSRAKVLFNLSRENDKIVLVQAALLLSFWFADTDEVKQSWYWTGVAFSTAQSLGLHMHGASRRSGSYGELWRDVWGCVWDCCLLRDVWQASGRGRPLRLTPTESGESLPEAIHHQFMDLKLHGETLYSTSEAVGLSKMWHSLLSISTAVREIITATRPLTPSHIKSLQKRLRDMEYADGSSTLQFVERHLGLHRCAARIALSHATHNAEEKANAADSMTAILSAFMDDKTILAMPVTVPLLVPAIAAYLSTLKEGNQDARSQLGKYEYFLTALEDNYPAASMLKRILIAAKEAIEGRGIGEEVRTEIHVQAGKLRESEQDGFFDVFWFGDLVDVEVGTFV